MLLPAELSGHMYKAKNHWNRTSRLTWKVSCEPKRIIKIAEIAFMYSTYFAFYLFTALPTASHISDLFRQKSKVSASGSLVGIRAL